MHFAREDGLEHEGPVRFRFTRRTALDCDQDARQRTAVPGVDDRHADGRACGYGLGPRVWHAPGRCQQDDDQIRNPMHGSVGSTVENRADSPEIGQ